MICYYCEEAVATAVRNSEPACDECNNRDVRMILDPKVAKNDTDKERASRLRMAIQIFKLSEKEDRIIEESTDPEELMDWLNTKAKYAASKGMFKDSYEKFINRWKVVFGNTDNIPQSFKNNINVKFRGMRSRF